jgi:hypothetical protein
MDWLAGCGIAVALVIALIAGAWFLIVSAIAAREIVRNLYDEVCVSSKYFWWALAYRSYRKKNGDNARKCLVNAIAREWPSMFDLGKLNVEHAESWVTANRWIENNAPKFVKETLFAWRVACDERARALMASDVDPENKEDE